ncbi:MAG: carbon-nitrogen hydrolase family protein [Clostridia bacterium]|nr:carbon-nitrogen hydrolase family protein [Clostridia bacterium]
MKNLKVALLQIAPTGGLKGNLEKGIEYCRKAKMLGADIAVFPEMFSCGYDIYERPFEVWRQDEIEKEHEFVGSFGKLARELEMAIGITYLEKYEPLPRNSMVLFDRSGKCVLEYAKVHTCDFGVERSLSPGEDFYVAELDTEKGFVRVGAMICYDREFPESGRILMLKGAEIVLVPNACPMEINRLSQLRARAYENMFGIATCNYPDSVPDCNGHSSAFDGVAYLPELMGSRDTCLVEANGSEGIFVAEFDMDMIRKYRSSEVHGDAYRRPEKYGLLTVDDKKEPFLRADFRG